MPMADCCTSGLSLKRSRTQQAAANYRMIGLISVQRLYFLYTVLHRWGNSALKLPWRNGTVTCCCAI